jgi:hypothetical protein
MALGMNKKLTLINMEFTTTGTVLKVGKPAKTKNGKAFVQLDFEGANKRVFYPTLMGDNVYLATDIAEGQRLRITCRVCGSKTPKGVFNNVLIDALSPA